MCSVGFYKLTLRTIVELKHEIGKKKQYVRVVQIKAFKIVFKYYLNDLSSDMFVNDGDNRCHFHVIFKSYVPFQRYSWLYIKYIRYIR